MAARVLRRGDDRRRSGARRKAIAADPVHLPVPVAVVPSPHVQSGVQTLPGNVLPSSARPRRRATRLDCADAHRGRDRPPARERRGRGHAPPLQPLERELPQLPHAGAVREHVRHLEERLIRGALVARRRAGCAGLRFGRPRLLRGHRHGGRGRALTQPRSAVQFAGQSRSSPTPGAAGAGRAARAPDHRPQHLPAFPHRAAGGPGGRGRPRPGRRTSARRGRRTSGRSTSSRPPRPARACPWRSSATAPPTA